MPEVLYCWTETKKNKQKRQVSLLCCSILNPFFSDIFADGNEGMDELDLLYLNVIVPRQILSTH